MERYNPTSAAQVPQPPSPHPRERVLLVVPIKEPDTLRPAGLDAPVMKQDVRYVASWIEGMSGDRVFLDVPGLGAHEFDRITGAYLAGPVLNLVDATIWHYDHESKVHPNAFAKEGAGLVRR